MRLFSKMTDERDKDEARREAAREHAQRLKEALNPKHVPPGIERLLATFQGDKAQRGSKTEATSLSAPKRSVAAASTQRKKTPTRQRQAGDLLNEHNVAAALSVSVQTIRRWRMSGRGPKFVKVNGYNVRYKPEDVTAYLNGQPSGGGQSKKGK
jgi:hypothetical protein